MSKYFNFKRSRLKLTVVSDFFLLLITGFAIWHDMSGTASAAIGGILSITSMYIYSDGKRPSNNA